MLTEALSFKSSVDVDEATAKLVVSVAFNAIQLSDISITQLQSSAKALNIKSKAKDKLELVKLVVEALIDNRYVKVLE